ncbi:ABC transporter substrate-binding protein [Prosthecomicrobium pneumaticum]|uniref:Multiple sugar transport system substrate-binding protein n=1 Tax=Prosthecomicrobium pneumaticum TaxID=81895 RepID=A0A7W9FPL5_9HYPH|nr:ABC transporter substrate-binding protein [Prosthecomicrobium pneumaticum]MBB5754436.1 multiple sugar transport system substrate-binding protein [Prosthecomicrobium pneumaticum]
MDFTRRDLMRTTAGLAAGAALGGKLLGPTGARAQSDLSFKPEEGASLRVLRWSPFVKGDEEQWLALTKKFSEQTGVQVRVDKESWEDIRPKAAVAANVGSGPDIMLVWFDDPHQYPDKLLDVTDLADYLGGKYGGWYDGMADYARRDGKFIGLPLATIGNAIVYRESWVKEAGWSEFPTDTASFLELLKALQKNGHPGGFTHGHGVGDGNNYAHWLLWSHGGQMVDAGGKVVLDSAETMKSIEYAMELYKTFIPGTESWLDVNNNRAFLAGELSVIANGISAYYTPKNDPAQAELAADIRTCPLPIGPVGQSVELYQVTSAVIFAHTPYPNAAKEYLRFMYEEPQMQSWITASSAYCCQPLKAYENNPIWSSDRNYAPYAKASATLRPNGYAGPLGYASAGVMADYVLVDMYAEAVTGRSSPKEAIERAVKRANRYYSI